MIHNLILWVTALEFVILVTAKLFYSEFFHLEYLALRWNYCTNHLVVLLFLICLYMWQLLKSLFCSYELSFYCTFLSLLEFSINVRFYAQKPSVNNSVIFKHTRKAVVIFFSVLTLHGELQPILPFLFSMPWTAESSNFTKSKCQATIGSKLPASHWDFKFYFAFSEIQNWKSSSVAAAQCVLSPFAVWLKYQEVLGKPGWIIWGVVTSWTSFLCVGMAGFSWPK